MAGLREGGTGDDRRWMDRALEIAARGWGRVAPNPMVGAVVVKEGRVVGEGAHREFGGPHAEVRALEEAGGEAAGATLYVTLEPCRHQGKTPPCTRTILEAGVERVVAACRDPDAEGGGGARELAESGVEVVLGVGAGPARRLNARYLWGRIEERPYVELKYALSLDGSLSRRAGERTAVSGPEAGEYVHWLRAGFDAILVGRRTARVDDPRLTVRGQVVPREIPRRLVLDPALRIPLESRLVSTAGEIPVWLLAAPGAPAERRERLEERGVRVLTVAEESPGRLRPGSVLDALAGRGVRAVLVEGGGRVGSSFLRADLVDRMALLRAPVFFGPDGVPAFVGEVPAEGERWTPGESRELGRDHLWVLDRTRTLERLEEVS